MALVREIPISEFTPEDAKEVLLGWKTRELNLDPEKGFVLAVWVEENTTLNLHVSRHNANPGSIIILTQESLNRTQLDRLFFKEATSVRIETTEDKNKQLIFLSPTMYYRIARHGLEHYVGFGPGLSDRTGEYLALATLKFPARL